MTVLEHSSSKKRFKVIKQALVGRDADCDLTIAGARVSKMHARIEWGPKGWQIRDLGSRNGTFVNGERLDAGSDRLLETEDELRFAEDDGSWFVIELNPPPACARNQSSKALAVAQGGLLLLPSDDNPRATLYENDDGSWQMEVEGVVVPVQDGQQLKIDGDDWLLELSPSIDPTLQERESLLRLENLEARFVVSLDEERIKLELLAGERCIDVPQRSFHYLLLTLARRRLEDSAAGHPAQECGWIDRHELYDMLRADRERFNKDVSRARKQFAELGISGAHGIIEVWGDARRIGMARLSIGR